MRQTHLLFSPFTVVLIVQVSFLFHSGRAIAADIIYVHQMRGGGGGTAPGPGGGSLEWEDDQWRALLESNGHTIVAHDFFDDLDVDETKLDQLNAADLVIFSRDSASGDYNSPSEQEIWTEGITAPMLIFTPYVLRASRWSMVDGETIVDALEPLHALVPTHPIFQGVTLDASNQVDVWDEDLLEDEDHIDILSGVDTGNGEVLAEEVDTGNPWIVYWEKGESFHDAAPCTAGGPRLFLTVGSDDDPFSWGEKNVTAAGEKLVLNAIQFLTGGGAPSPGDFNSDQKLDAADLALLSQAQKTNDLAFDLNADGTTNVADRIHWVNNLKKTWVGDSNFDGLFNSSDFVQVFQAGLLETGQMAGWETGDWDGDMTFSSGDFVVAFQNGGFEQGPRPATAAVPEPLSSVLGWMALAAFGVWAHRRPL
jgi:hypothetical protein